jgi:hypothetical protein
MAYKMRAQTGDKQKQFIQSGKMGLEAKGFLETEEANAKRSDSSSIVAPAVAAEPEPSPVVTYATAAAVANQITASPGAAPIVQENASTGSRTLSDEDYAFFQTMRERQLVFDRQQHHSGQSMLMQGQYAQQRPVSVMSP